MAAEAPDILSPAFNEDPYPILEALREDHPLHFHEQMDSYLITRYEDVSSACEDLAFANGPPKPVGVFTRSPVHMPLTFRPAA